LAPPQNFPGTGPDLTLFMMLLGLGFALGLLGYLTGSKTLRLVGILLVMAATGVLMVTVFTTPTFVVGLSWAAPLWGRRADVRRRIDPEREVSE
jgi:hypothetical protein